MRLMLALNPYAWWVCIVAAVCVCLPSVGGIRRVLGLMLAFDTLPGQGLPVHLLCIPWHYTSCHTTTLTFTCTQYTCQHVFALFSPSALTCFLSPTCPLKQIHIPHLHHIMQQISTTHRHTASTTPHCIAIPLAAWIRLAFSLADYPSSLFWPIVHSHNTWEVPPKIPRQTQYQVSVQHIQSTLPPTHTHPHFHIPYPCELFSSSLGLSLSCFVWLVHILSLTPTQVTSTNLAPCIPQDLQQQQLHSTTPPHWIAIPFAAWV